MSKLRVLIVDDEPLARERVALMLRQDPEIEIVGECGDGRSALAEIRARRPDLVFLDVQMSQHGGIEVLEKFEAENRPAVIFVTAYGEYAVRAFELGAVDYLLKPFRDQRFKAAVERAKDQMRRTDYGEVRQQAKALIDHLRRIGSPGEAVRQALPGSSAGRLVFKVGGEYVFVEMRDIAWIEAQGNFVKLGVGNQSLRAREVMHILERRLDAALFVRTHRSFIVNATCIKKITPARFGDQVVLMNDGAKIRLSRTYHGNLKRLLSS